MGSSLTRERRSPPPPLPHSPSPSPSSHLDDSLLEHSGSVDVICFSDDGSVMATGSDDCTVRIWSTMTSQCQCIGILVGHESYVTSVAIEEIYVISGSWDSTVRKWDMTSCACVFVCLGHRSGVNRVLCTGEFILSSSSDSTVRCWNFDTGQCVQVFAGHRNSVTPLIFIPATTNGDSDVGDDVTTTTVSNNGDVMVSGSSDWTSRCWSMDDGRAVAVFRGHGGIVTCLSSNRDGRILVSGSVDCSVRTWAMRSGQQLQVLDGHSASVICLVVFNDVIFTGSSDATGRAWAINEGLQEVVVFKGHSRTILCIRQKNGIVMTGAADGSVICFDARSGNIKRIFKGPTNAVVNRLQVAGRRLFACSTDGFVRIWNLTGLFENDLKTSTEIP